MWQEGTKRHHFDLMCKCGIWCSFAGSLWSFAGGLWSFLVVACFSNLAIMIYKGKIVAENKCKRKHCVKNGPIRTRENSIFEHFSRTEENRASDPEARIKWVKNNKIAKVLLVARFRTHNFLYWQSKIIFNVNPFCNQ